MDKKITVEMPIWLAMKAMEALHKSDPMGLHIGPELRRFAEQVKEGIDKQKVEDNKPVRVKK